MLPSIEKVPSLQAMQRSVHVQNRVKQPLAVEEKISTLIKELGDRKKLNRKNPAANAKIANIASQIFVDPKNPSKVYAVGLLAIRRSGINPSRADYLAFENAVAKARAAKVQAEVTMRDEIDWAKELNRLDFIAMTSGKSQLQGNLREWIVSARKAGFEKHKEQIEALKELLVCPISYEAWDDPILCSDGHTYNASTLAQMGEHPLSPFTREPLSVIGPHEEAKQALEWARKF